MMSQPSEEDRAAARSQALLSLGLGMMANSTGPRGANGLGQIVGRAGLGSMDDYQRSLMMAQQRKQHEFQTGLALQKMSDEQRVRKAQQAYLQSNPNIPEEVRAGVVPFSEWWKRQNPEDAYKTVGDSLVKITPKGAESVFQNKKAPDGFEYDQSGQLVPIGAYWDQKVRVAQAGKPSIENKVYNVAETEQAKAWGKTLGELRSNFANSAFTAPSKLNQLDRMEQLLSGVEGGKLAPLGMEVASAAKSLGLNIDPKLGNKEAAEALSREIAGSFRQPGTGPMTDKDFDNFLKRVPDLSKTAQGRQEIFTTMRSALKRDIEANKIVSNYAKRRNGNIDDGVMDELADFYAKNPVVNNKQSGGGFKIIGVR